ncbi:phosphoglucosamine mutase, partial [bacterium]|nr:phosphoglucosamine mutase [bacterium]
ASYLKAHDKSFDNKVIATVMSNFGLEQALTKLGVKLIRTSVGDKYVLDELLKTGASIGGEQSGHIIFPKISLAGDGLITAIEILRVMNTTGKSPSELMQDFEHYPQIILNVNVPHKHPIENYPAITKAIKNIENELGNKGRILVRYSGTENKLRIMIEGTNKELITQQAESLAAIVSAEIK